MMTIETPLCLMDNYWRPPKTMKGARNSIKFRHIQQDHNSKQLVNLHGHWISRFSEEAWTTQPHCKPQPGISFQDLRMGS